MARYLSISIAFLIVSVANCNVTVSWYYRGASIPANASLSLRVGDSLALKCRAVSNICTHSAVPPIFVLTHATSSSIKPIFSIAYTHHAISSATTLMIQSDVSSSGTVIYDSSSGVRPAWSQWLVSDKISPAGVNITDATGCLSTGWLSVFASKLESTHAGTIYCAYVDASDVTSSLIGISSGITLSFHTNEKGDDDWSVDSRIVPSKKRE